MAFRDNLRCSTFSLQGKPLTPITKSGFLSGVRRFFKDCQEWEWIPRKFSPERALATPRSITALIKPNPRVIADDIWAKLLWTGLNLAKEDLPLNALSRDYIYPLSMVQAITITWLFAGIRNNEYSSFESRLYSLAKRRYSHPRI